MTVRNRNMVRVDTRLKTLTTAVGEYAAAFGAGEDCLDSIRKGVGERQIIETIELNYYSRRKWVGRVTMEIDWDKHQILVNSDHGDEFHFETGRSVLEQLDAASQEIIRHVERMKEMCHVTRVKPTYIYRTEYRFNKKKEAEAEKFLGHTSTVVYKDRGEESPEFKTYIRFVMDKLSELTVTVEN